jgi:cytochrome c oxidase subunit III
MEIGTIKTKIATEKKLRSRPKFSGFGGSKGNGGGNNGGDDNSNNPNDSATESYEKSFSKSKILTYFLLLVVLMTFGGLISAYIVVATNGVLEWKPFNLPFQVWISTIIILASSLTYSFAQKAISSGKTDNSKKWLVATTVLGAIFISSQILVWFELVRRGYYMQSNPYIGFFYMMTALHAAHVIGGIVALGYVILRIWNGNDSEKELIKRKEISNAVGWYWHFMGGLWIVLLSLLAFWK